MLACSAQWREPPSDLTVPADRFFTEYHGAFVESYVAQQVVATIQHDLYYWRSRGGKAELDFLLELPGGIVPVEVAAAASCPSHSFRPTAPCCTSALPHVLQPC